MKIAPVDGAFPVPCRLSVRLITEASFVPSATLLLWLLCALFAAVHCTLGGVLGLVISFFCTVLRFAIDRLCAALSLVVGRLCERSVNPILFAWPETDFM
jgi:hypothetical protein